jgi:hypothetical protein
MFSSLQAGVAVSSSGCGPTNIALKEYDEIYEEKATCRLHRKTPKTCSGESLANE